MLAICVTFRVEVGDKVMLEVSSWKEVVHFGKKEMLAPRYVGPFEIIKGSVVKSRDEISLRRGYYDNCALSSYACSDSLLLTPLCCDYIHEVTPHVSALAGCDRLVSEPLVIENYVSLIRKKFRWGTIFLIGLKRYRDPKEEPIEKEPLMELKEIGEHESRNVVWPGQTNGKEGSGDMYLIMSSIKRDVRNNAGRGSWHQRSYVLWAEIGEIRSIGSELGHETTIRVEVGDKVMFLERSSAFWKERNKYLADTNLNVHFEEIKVDKTLCFVEEPVEIIDREVKSLNRSRIPIVKSIGTRSEGVTLKASCEEETSLRVIKFSCCLPDYFELKDANACHLKIFAITPRSWKGHLDNQIDLELLDLHDRCYGRQAMVDNTVNKRAREFLQVIEKMSGEADVIKTRERSREEECEELRVKIAQQSKVIPKGGEKDRLEDVEASLHREVEELKQDRRDVVLKVINYAAMELVYSDKLGSLVGMLVSSVITYGRCRAYEQSYAFEGLAYDFHMLRATLGGRVRSDATATIEALLIRRSLPRYKKPDLLHDQNSCAFLYVSTYVLCSHLKSNVLLMLIL
ncbi:hypothetical protein Tco_0696887 [Tanacetum coccineum]